MRNGKLGMLIAENESWRSSIKFLEEQNIRFKTQLADILSKDGHVPGLDQLEDFQNRFIKMDEQISLVRHEVREQLYQLQQFSRGNSLQYRRAIELQEGLKVKVHILHENFRKLRTEFNIYLQSNVH